MTMDNGEGRPLDEAEAGNDDPQGWYFDLPGGAWERQEEKNRTLRQRVLGNLTEDEAKAKSDPFGRKAAEPEEKKGGRGFFGRRKKDDDQSDQRTSAGGTWVLNRGNQPADDEPPFDDSQSAPADDDSDDWSTEPPLKLTPFPRTAERTEPQWGEPEGGFAFSAPVEPEPVVPAQDATDAYEEDEEPQREPAVFRSAAIDENDEPDSGTQDFLASMRSWAEEQHDQHPAAPDPVQFRVPTFEEAAAEATGWDTAPAEEQPSLTLRPRQRAADDKQLDWNFGPAAWSDEPKDEEPQRNLFAPTVEDEPAEEPADLGFQSMRRWAEESRDKDHPHFTTHEPATHETIDEPDESEQVPFQPAAIEMDSPAASAESDADEESSDGMSFESMRRWAEQNRDADHPHFAVAHHESSVPEPEEPQTAPIPLRPRAHDEDAQPPSGFAPVPHATSSDDAPRAPLQLPIMRRPREQEPEPVHSEKWNEFFAIPDAEATADADDEQPSDGLAAMRAWAQKRQEPETPENIPEEFLKPFDWELEEPAAYDAAASGSIPPELLKPFAWEEETSADTPAFEAEEPAPAAPNFSFEPREEAPAALAPEAELEPRVDDSDDLLEGIFPAAPAVAVEPPREEKKKGRFGRMFGRGKNKDSEPLQPVEEPAAAVGDWLLPSDDDESDIRVAAQLDDWAEDAGTLEAPEALKLTGEGWGASLREGWTDTDRDAIQEFSHAVTEAESGWDPAPVDTETLSAPDEPAESPVFEHLEAAFESASEDTDDNGWNPEPVAERFSWKPAADTEAVASLEAPEETDDAADGAWWEQPAAEAEPEAPVEAVASVESTDEPEAETPAPWWEQPAAEAEAEPEAPVEAVASVEATDEPEAETPAPWWEQPAAEVEPEAPVEAVASVEAAEESTAETPAPWWEQPAAEAEPEVPVEAVASVEAIEDPAVETPAPWWEQPAAEAEPETPVEAVASVEATDEPAAETPAPWWEQPAAEAEPEAPIEAVASVEATDEPVAETPAPWWEQPAAEAEPEAPVEAVASVEAPEEPAVETPAPWWEQPAVEAEPEAPIEAVASVEATDEPEAETPAPWWEQPAAEVEPEAPVEAVASVEASEEPVAETPSPWWQQPTAAAEAEPEAPVEAVASVEATDEPEAETPAPWWEQPAAEAEPEAPVEAAASVEATEESAAETPAPWWEQPAAEVEPEAPVEAVASVEASEEPAAETPAPWWEQPAAEAESEAPVEAVASVEATDEPEAETPAPWWEQPAAEVEPEAPVEAVASVEATDEPAAETPAPWWEQPAVEAEPEAPAEAVASVEATAPVEAVASVESDEDAADGSWWEQPAETEPEAADVPAVAHVEEQPVEAAPQAAATVAAEDEDDPWADFVNAPTTTPSVERFAATTSRWGQEPARPTADEDMWGHIAAQAEEHATAEHQLDLAASLESQMAEEHAAPAPHWTERESHDWDTHDAEPDGAFSPAQDEDDVILAAFERHAATPEAVPATRENDEVFAELLGNEAADIVAEASDDDAGRESFIKMSAWAPQRRSDFDGGWAPEHEVEEALSGGRSSYGGSDGAGFAPPSWAVDELEGDGEPVPAVGGHHRTKTWIRELVETGLLALLVFLSVRASFQNFKVEGSSMYPTLENGQFLIVNKLVYSEVDMEKLSSFVPFVDAGSDPKHNVFHGPERGDIIVLKDPRNTETDLIKRVIGLPGETLEIQDGKVYINDHLLDEPYIKAVWHDTKQKILIPPGEYFVMGDNRDNSLDSRSSQVGLVPQDLIIGKAMLSYWPRDKFGLAPNEEGTLGDEKPVLTTKRIGE